MQISSTLISATYTAPALTQAPPPGPPPGPPPEGAAQVELSGPGALIADLEALMESDPAAATEALTAMAAEVRSRASEAEGGEAEHLEAMAERLEAAADAGDLSLLAPPKPPEASSGSSTSGASAYANEQQRGAQPDHRELFDALRAIFDEVTG